MKSHGSWTEKTATVNLLVILQSAQFYCVALRLHVNIGLNLSVCSGICFLINDNNAALTGRHLKARFMLPGSELVRVYYTNNIPLEHTHLARGDSTFFVDGDALWFLQGTCSCGAVQIWQAIWDRWHKKGAERVTIDTTDAHPVRIDQLFHTYSTVAFANLRLRLRLMLAEICKTD